MMKTFLLLFALIAVGCGSRPEQKYTAPTKANDLVGEYVGQVLSEDPYQEPATVELVIKRWEIPDGVNARGQVTYHSEMHGRYSYLGETYPVKIKYKNGMFTMTSESSLYDFSMTGIYSKEKIQGQALDPRGQAILSLVKIK